MAALGAMLQSRLGFLLNPTWRWRIDVQPSEGASATLLERFGNTGGVETQGLAEDRVGPPAPAAQQPSSEQQHGGDLSTELAGCEKTKPLTAPSKSTAAKKKNKKKEEVAKALAGKQAPRKHNVAAEKATGGKVVATIAHLEEIEQAAYMFPGTVTILGTRKQAKARAYASYACSKNSTESIEIYADGSKLDDGRAGAAVAFKDREAGGTWVDKYWAVRGLEHIGDIELFAISAALEIAALRKQEGASFVSVSIFSDCRSALELCHTTRALPLPPVVTLVRDRAERLVALGVKLHLHWVSGHKGVEGNERAHRGAQCGAQISSGSYQGVFTVPTRFEDMGPACIVPPERAGPLDLPKCIEVDQPRKPTPDVCAVEEPESEPASGQQDCHGVVEPTVSAAEDPNLDRAMNLSENRGASEEKQMRGPQANEDDSDATGEGSDGTDKETAPPRAIWAIGGIEAEGEFEAKAGDAVEASASARRMAMMLFEELPGDLGHSAEDRIRTETSWQMLELGDCQCGNFAEEILEKLQSVSYFDE